jgi:hypothetical protein
MKQESRLTLREMCFLQAMARSRADNKFMRSGPRSIAGIKPNSMAGASLSKRALGCRAGPSSAAKAGPRKLDLHEQITDITHSAIHLDTKDAGCALQWSRSAAAEHQR